MVDRNVRIPTEVERFSDAVGAKFFYLSSLAVFGVPSGDVVGLKSDRRPIDVYGDSKNQFDQYINGLEASDRICTIYPASIHSGKGRSSVEKFCALVNRFLFLKLVSLPGCLSYIERDALIEVILNKVRSSDIADCIVSKDFALRGEAFRLSIRIPKFPLWFFRLVERALGRAASVKARMLLRGIHYVNAD